MLGLFLINGILFFRPMFSRFYLSHILVPFLPGLHHDEPFPVFYTNLSLFLSWNVEGQRGWEGYFNTNYCQETRVSQVVISFFLVWQLSWELAQCVPICEAQELGHEYPVQEPNLESKLTSPTGDSQPWLHTVVTWGPTLVKLNWSLRVRPRFRYF